MNAPQPSDSEVNAGQSDESDVSTESTEEQLVAVAEDTVEQLENTPDDRIKAEKQKRQAIDELAEAVAEAEVAPEHVNTERWISMVASVTRDVTKTEIKDEVESKIDDTRQSESGRETIDEWLERNTNCIVEMRSTDYKQDTIWRWEFGNAAVETASTKDGIEHMRFDALRNAVYEATGEWTAKPSEGRRSGEEWRDYIVDFIENRVEKSTTRGQRSVTVDRLKDWVRQNNAYHDILDVINHGGARIDEEKGELYIPNQHIKRWCDSSEISPRAFQSELDSRGLLSDRISGASERTSVEIDSQHQSVTYWVIDLDALDVDPYDVIEEPETPAEMDEDGGEEEEQDESGESENGGENFEQSGVVDAIGGDAGDDDE